jgi:hypothetical protein
VASKLAAGQGMEPDRVDYMLFDQRHHKPRINRYKLSVDSVREAAT